jgi:hypothetical protein
VLSLHANLDKQLPEQLSEELARLCSDILELETPLLAVAATPRRSFRPLLGELPEQFIGITE